MKILFITGGAPWPVTLGVNQRTNLLYSSLKKLASVDLVICSSYAVKSEEERKYIESEYGLIDIIRPYEKLLFLGRLVNFFLRNVISEPCDQVAKRKIQRIIKNNKYDLVVCRYIRTAVIVGADELGLPLIVDADDVDTQVLETRIEQSALYSKIRLKYKLFQIRRMVKKILSYASYVWIVSVKDRSFVSNEHVGVLPNIPFVQHDGSSEVIPAKASNIAVIVASCLHTVNLESINRFLLKSWPLVLSAIPNATLNIVGHGMTEELKNQWAKINGVVPVGQVDDIREEYNKSALSVVPIWEGGGTKIKVIESLLYGRVPVVSSHAVRGLEALLDKPDGLISSNDDTELADSIILMMKNEILRERIVNEGKKRVDKYFSPECFSSAVKEGVDLVSGGGR